LPIVGPAVPRGAARFRGINGRAWSRLLRTNSMSKLFSTAVPDGPCPASDFLANMRRHVLRRWMFDPVLEEPPDVGVFGISRRPAAGRFDQCEFKLVSCPMPHLQVRMEGRSIFHPTKVEQTSDPSEHNYRQSQGRLEIGMGQRRESRRNLCSQGRRFRLNAMRCGSCLSPTGSPEVRQDACSARRTATAAQLKRHVEPP
jgi:hypothetical protein